MTHRSRKPLKLAAVVIAGIGCLGAVLAAIPAGAQTYVSLGYGGVSCADWGSRKPLEAKAYEAWMLGYITSYNAFVFRGPNVVAGTEVDDLRKWVDAYCKQNPQENFDTVVRLLIDDFAKRIPN
jgi:hypothetical protein